MSLLQGFVELPSDQQTAITALVVLLLGLVFSYVGSKLPWTVPFLSKYKDEISLSVAASFLALVQNALPSEYPQISISFVGLVLAVLTGVGVKFIASKNK